ncbi:olfactory receptor 5AP2-like [Tachyglossus aculeatus]|uniref:olfactory receptor 5AP2-like n=1 Tax=Tachyglossus aculeatus TaxID=9261 RepID=UPI0018F78E27|nr:olfactory receptor 5AP2-like [Tachyglossus aculeatus]
MAERNGPAVTSFLLTGLSDRPEVRFAAFHAVYLAMLLANGALLLALRADRHLHTPMYFFLANLSLLDVSRPTAALYFLVSPAGMVVLLLAVTASERWLAILCPLCYAVLMDGSVCVALAAGPALAVGGIGAFSITLVSYVLVAAAILKSRWAEGKRRAWSTCTFCLLAVGLFYGPIIFTYILPSSGPSPRSDGLVSMLYGVLNALLDSLRNEEAKGDLRRVAEADVRPAGISLAPEPISGLVAATAPPTLVYQNPTLLVGRLTPTFAVAAKEKGAVNYTGDNCRS